MSEKQYDLVILGGGTAGYVAAIRASQLGKKVALVENKLLGGTCLHKGCIPTKALLKSAEVLRTIQNANDFGVHVDSFNFNYEEMLNRKESIVNQMYSGVQHLMKSNHIDIYNGTGRILGSSIFSPQSGTISVEYEDGESELLPNQFVLIATGATPTQLSFLPYEHQNVLSSDDLLNLNTLPSSISILGAGVIGLEFASLMIDLGVEVHVFELGDRILPTESETIAKTLQNSLENKGVAFHLNANLSEENITLDTKKVSIKLNDLEINSDKILVSIGRTANTSDIGLNNTKVKTSSSGRIITNQYMQTEDGHIYAAGDCIEGIQLAHVASKEGIVAVEHMFEENPLTIDYHKIPRCVYTDPEIASIGYDEKVAKDKAIDAITYKLPFKANGKALIESNQNQDYFIQVTVDKNDNEIIGLSMIGNHVTELINEVSLLQFMNGSSLELGLTTHAHPSMSEILMEAGLKIENRAIHI